MMAQIEYEPHPDGGMIETTESWDRRMEERYRPDPTKPWRVAWGFGCFEDFATREEAQACYDELPEGLMPHGPFNAIESWES